MKQAAKLIKVYLRQLSVSPNKKKSITHKRYSNSNMTKRKDGLL